MYVCVYIYIYIYMKKRETKVRPAQYSRDMRVCEQFCGEGEYLKISRNFSHKPCVR